MNLFVLPLPPQICRALKVENKKEFRFVHYPVLISYVRFTFIYVSGLNMQVLLPVLVANLIWEMGEKLLASMCTLYL